jgi:hypothetical protein
MVFVIAFSVISAAVLDIINTGFRTTEAIADVRDDQQRVDAAMEAAINAVRNAYPQGMTGADPDGKPGSANCPDFVYDDGVGSPITVQCAADLAGGSVGTAPGAAQPEHAILALGSGSEGVVVTGGDDATVIGAIHSNGVINLSGGSSRQLSVFGSVGSVGTCSPSSCGVPTRIFASGSVRCPSAAAPAEADPDYPAAAGSITGMAVDPPATCQGGTVRFSPGLYSEPPPDFVSGLPCDSSNATWWFTPGTYYFDFRTEWSSNRRVVGGTLDGSGTRCNPGSEAAPLPGVQFILGGATRISVSNRSFMLCAGTNPGTGQRIAFYGLKSESRPAPATITGLSNIQSTTQFQNAGNARQVDGSTAFVDLPRGGTATITLDDFRSGAGSPIPPGSLVQSAQLRYRHTLGQNTTATLRLDTGPGTSDETITASNSSSTQTTDILDELDDLDGNFPWQQLRDLRVTYEARRSNSNSGGSTQRTHLDGIELVVTYVAPGFEAHSCPGNCAILDADDSDADLFLTGTLYAPTARVDLRLDEDDEVELGRGVIARAVNLRITDSSDLDEAPFSLPLAAAGRVVQFTALLDGQVELRARVVYDDSGNVPGRAVTVTHWVPAG